jgi:hypothetical protein
VRSITHHPANLARIAARKRQQFEERSLAVGASELRALVLTLRVA